MRRRKRARAERLVGSGDGSAKVWEQWCGVREEILT
jgi:hypothetical protein